MRSYEFGNHMYRHRVFKEQKGCMSPYTPETQTALRRSLRFESLEYTDTNH